MSLPATKSLSEHRSMLDVSRHLTLQNTLYFEARLLDEERFREWLDLISDNISYRMPVTSRRFRKDRSSPLSVGEGDIFAEDRGQLRLRIDRLESGLVWAEDPRNHVRRVISNVEIRQGVSDYQADVISIVTIHRSRIDGQERRLVARRNDVWSESDSRWRLESREIELDHTVVPDSNLNVFF